LSLPHRADFPFIARDDAICYLDNAATTQKPNQVLNRVHAFDKFEHANVYRATHTASVQATEALEAVREGVRAFLNARHKEEIIFTHGTTSAINLAAYSLSRSKVKKGQRILLGTNSHHSNIVPWQRIAAECEAVLRPIPLNSDGSLNLDWLEQELKNPTAIVSVSHVSNSAGTLNPVEKIVHMARKNGAVSLIDGAQAVSHAPVNVQTIDCDFYTFSGHKLFAPTGSGILFIKKEHHNTLPPWQLGGEMVQTVSFEDATFQKAPTKFEAGTPSISALIGLGAAIEFLNAFPWPDWKRREQELTHFAFESLSQLDGIEWAVPGPPQAPILAFNLQGLHCADVSEILDYEGVATRAGTHCSMPFYRALGLNGSIRASLSIYNNESDIERLLNALAKALELLR